MKTSIRNIVREILQTVLLGLTFVPSSYSQESQTTQTLTLQVLEMNKIDVSSRTLSLTVSSLQPNTAIPAPVVNANTTLIWTSNGENRKITVATNNASPKFILRVVAENISPAAGIAVSEAVLSDNSTYDLVAGLGRSAGKCTLRYTASASIDRGAGIDSHLITFTITSG